MATVTEQDRHNCEEHMEFETQVGDVPYPLWCYYCGICDGTIGQGKGSAWPWAINMLNDIAGDASHNLPDKERDVLRMIAKEVAGLSEVRRAWEAYQEMT